MSNPTLPPAPWTVRGNRVYAADGEEIAVATNASPRWRKHSDATAQVLAAAPELLARSVALVKWLDAWSARDSFGKPDFSELHDMRAAIARATGEEVTHA